MMLEGLTQAVRLLAFMVLAGLGVQEAGLVLFGHALGISGELALSVSMAKRMREVLCGLPSLLSWQWMEGRRLKGLAPTPSYACSDYRSGDDRSTASGPNACCTGMTSIALTFTCDGRRRIDSMTCATSCADNGRMPAKRSRAASIALEAHQRELRFYQTQLDRGHADRRAQQIGSQIQRQLPHIGLGGAVHIAARIGVGGRYR